ncbi:hypothetical protein CAOG_06533 [Capsaspora owczarzaki ATCC 30864]|uniref:Uncharacterized protein n=1 Tax=Capsaspora owczarzaki (strain ATCC 30864) TaxID=595528 RepID=A0A0D2VX46_CAPO3|nr:hypothetical protein CAOG_06533 [Capsaspora owczarzaki ATCC 30864]KJE96172.1 hypothetical protein CAOG_006533 [Capsaspora owczarzaki ATCC 30864]|eukprot:XP_004345282.2 hypothetical protein CAOG_06533 [Capsaspora owczarzaki ATCC 30864]
MLSAPKPRNPRPAAAAPAAPAVAVAPAPRAPRAPRAAAAAAVPAAAPAVQPQPANPAPAHRLAGPIGVLQQSQSSRRPRAAPAAAQAAAPVAAAPAVVALVAAAAPPGGGPNRRKNNNRPADSAGAAQPRRGLPRRRRGGAPVAALAAANAPVAAAGDFDLGDAPQGALVDFGAMRNGLPPNGPSAPSSVSSVASSKASRKPLTERNVAIKDRSHYQLYMFGCEGCSMLWYKKCAPINPVSPCRGCNTRYDPIPIGSEPVGLGFFRCSKCKHQWTSCPAARNVSQPCFGGKCVMLHHEYPYKVLPRQSMRSHTDETQRKSDNKHSCAACGGEGQCPLRRRGDVFSKAHVSAPGSIGCSSSPGSERNWLSDENYNKYRHLMNAHDYEDFDGDD